MPARTDGSSVGGGGRGQLKPNNQNSSSSGQMTKDEFKEWLKRFDANKDGRISKKELREALRNQGFWYLSALRKASQAVRYADLNRNGYIDDDEVDLVVELASKYFGIKLN